MSDTVIRVEGLGKKYIIGHQFNGSDGLRHVLQDKLTAPLRWARSKAQRAKSRPLSSGLTPDLRPPTSEVFWALRDVSFDVTQGEVVGIIGRNGAGKSTLLKILSRITEPTTGRVRIRGRVASLLEVGTGFHPELTGRENVFLNGAILGMTREEIKRRFDEIVAFAEVEKFLDTPVKRYSSGMYVRLAFAVAAHLEPEILIVDEVLAVGDAQFQKKCLGKMDEVSKQGRTVLFVSHNMTAVKSLCSKALWLDGGVVVGSGETGQVVSDYLQNGAASVLEQEWADGASAPGNDKIRIRCARVFGLGADPREQITVETSLQMEFEFWNNIPDAVLNLTLHLFTIEGTYVFAVASSALPRKQGLVSDVVRIPPHLLNDGLYTVTIQVVQDSSTTVYIHPEILVFEVRDSDRVGNWFGKWPGVVRPKLEWLSDDDTVLRDSN